MNQFYKYNGYILKHNKQALWSISSIDNELMTYAPNQKEAEYVARSLKELGATIHNDRLQFSKQENWNGA